ncbi:hypothetical protein DFH94DRAFT_784367 [Russula ochroleuca]|uniref:Uncharacterized protein n=1 Tax=Russula ochroleuca TaxID=152965 RepID=A0A9P5MQ48_9AGAM|nr:hypothetical protein DFH94DRAFT_784367 [Russula ochroleuca]
MSPLSLSPFRTGPYEIEPPENPDDAFDKEEYVEQWRAEREALVEAVELTDRHNDMELLGLSNAAFRDCLPHLDVGDAFRKPSLLGHDDSRGKQGSRNTPGTH